MIQKQIQIRQQIFDNNGKRKRTLVAKRTPFVEAMMTRLDELDLLMNKLALILNELPLDEKNNFNQLNYFEDYSTFDYNKIFKLKQYLRWMFQQLKSINEVSEDNRLNFLINKSLDLTKNGIEEANILIQDYMQFNDQYIYNLRNRSGRLAEHVGTISNSLDYGNFLEKGLQSNTCRLIDFGICFTQSEIISVLKTSGTNFVASTLIASFCFYNFSINDAGFLNMFKKVYYDACKLLYQAYNQINFDSFRALTLLCYMSLFESDIKLFMKLNEPLLRMAYILGLDKINVKDELIKSQNKDDIFTFIMMLYCWNNIRISSINNHLFYTNLPSLNINNNFELKEFDNLRCLTKQYPNHFVLNQFFNSFRFRFQEAMMILSSHINNIKYINNNEINYKKIKLPMQGYRRVQNIINIYFKPSNNVLNDNLEKDKTISTSISKYLCHFILSHCHHHQMYHSYRQSILVYYLQIILIYPCIKYHPIQLEIPTNQMLILLEASIKMFYLLQMAIYVYFEQLYFKVKSTKSENQHTIKLLEVYLNTNPKPITYEGFDYLIQTIVSSLQFDAYIYPLYTFLLLLSSKNFTSFNYISKDYLLFIREHIIDILKVLDIINNLKDPKFKYDIEYVIENVKTYITGFDLPEDLKIDWNYYINLKSI